MDASHAQGLVQALQALEGIAMAVAVLLAIQTMLGTALAVVCFVVAVGMFQLPELAGSEAQQKRWLPALAAGDLVGSVALAESSEEWEPDAWRLELRDGGLHGEKRFVPFAGQAGLLLVGIRGGGLAIVEAGAPGLEIVDENGIDRTRPIARVRFDGRVYPVTAVLVSEPGKPGGPEGFDADRFVYRLDYRSP